MSSLLLCYRRASAALIFDLMFWWLFVAVIMDL